MKNKDKFTRFLQILIILLLILIFLKIFLPPYMKDELTLYLSLPHYWELTHTSGPIWWFTNSFNPPYFIWLYYIIGPEHFTIIHFAGFLSLMLFVYSSYLLLKEFHFEEKFSPFFIFILITIPVVVQISSTAYLDLWLTDFAILSIYFLKKSASKNNFYFLLAAIISIALSCGTKYNGFLLSAIIYLIGGVTLQKNKTLLISFIILTPFVIILFNFPWIYMNYKVSGNPFYPLFPSFLTLSKISHFNPQPVHYSHYIPPLQYRSLGYGESPFWAFLAPLRVFFYGKEGSPALFDGALSAFFLLFLPFANYKKNRLNLFLLLGFFTYIYIALFTSPLRARYLLPSLSLIIIPSGEGLMTAYKKSKMLTGILLFLALIFPLYATVKHFSSNDIIQYITNPSKQQWWKDEHIPYFDFYRRINSSHCKKIFLYFLGKRDYYLDIPFMFEPKYNVEGSWLIHAWKTNNMNIFTSHNVTCLAYNKYFLARFIENNIPEEKRAKFLSYIASHCKLIYNSNITGLCRIKEPTP